MVDQKIFGAEKEHIWFLAHILAQKKALKQWANQCLSVSSTIDINYFFDTHWCTKKFTSETFGAEKHRDSTWVDTRQNWICLFAL